MSQTNGVMSQLGRESTFYALGKQWTLARFEADIWDDLLAWAKPRMPDVFAGLEMLAKAIPANAPADHPLAKIFEQKFSEAQSKAWRVASINSPEFLKLIDDTPEGNIQRFWLLLRIKHPEVTHTEALQIIQEIGPQLHAEMISKADGENPSGKA